MCGIWALFGYSTESVSHCDHSFSKIRHRGPDAWRIQFDNRLKETCIGFTRLCIVDSVWGMQPMSLHEYPHVTLICNGELYNCKRLSEEFNFKYETRCDVECIIQLYGAFGIEHTVQHLDGVFSFVLIDSKKGKLFAGRDPFGVRPLFRLETSGGVLGFCSEAKGLVSLTGPSGLPNGTTDEKSWSLAPFPPGHFVEYDLLADGKVRKVRQERYYKYGAVPLFRPFVSTSGLSSWDVSGNIRHLLTESVRKRLMSDRRIGCMLSGGLDSSLIAAILANLAKQHNLPYKIQTFAVGMGTSPDIVAARLVAEHIGTEHHEVIFTEETVKEVLDRVIYSLESCDITTVRASLGMYILSEFIRRETDSTVIFSGEGSDELTQGYIYFRRAPSAEAAHAESLRLLSDIYLYDGLRADRTTAAHSLELRVPFLDLQFTQYILSLPPESRQPQNGVEKHLLRSAFSGTGLLPDSILWRTKEAFSDGVASVKKSLFEVIQELVEGWVSDAELQSASHDYPHLTPTTKEALYYRKVLEKEFPGRAADLTPYFWMPKWSNVDDPSARFLDHYKTEETKTP